MSDPAHMYHVYRPSGFVGTMTLDAAVEIAAKDSQVMIEPADKPPSKQAAAVIKAAEKRTGLQHRWVQAQECLSRFDMILGGLSLLGLFCMAVLLVASWI